MLPGILTFIDDELKLHEFIPSIHRSRKASSFAMPSAWQVETSRDDTSFVLRGEEDIGRIGAHGLRDIFL